MEVVAMGGRRSGMPVILLALVAVGALAVAACTREVEVEKVVEKVVQQTVVVEKQVKQTVVVEKQVVVERTVVVLPTPAPKGPRPSTWGGTLRLAAHGPPAHYDVLGTSGIANIGSQMSMYSRLIRHIGVTSDLPIVPDLAYRWEVSPDGRTYTFFLREGVKFHDGSVFDAEDVQASIKRLAFPPQGRSGWAALIGEVTEVNVINPLTVEIRSSGSKPLIPILANGSALMLSKDTLEKYGGNLATVDNAPGTGPFKYVSRNDEKWVQERFVDYWDSGKPHADRLEHIWLKAWSNELAAALLTGSVDWAQWLPATVGKEIRDGKQPGLKGVSWNLPLADILAMNVSRKPFDDKRVRKAFALVIDQSALRDAVKDIRVGDVGGWFIVGSPYALSETELMKIPGIRVPTGEDIALAKSLLAEAGYPNGQGFPTVDYMTRDVPDERILSAAVQAMVKKHLNVEMKIRIVDASIWSEQSKKLEYGFTSGFGLSGPTTDPADYLFSGLSCKKNIIGWCNEEFDALIGRFAKTSDLRQRLAIANEIRTLLYNEWPAIPMGSRPQYWGWRTYLGGNLPPSDFTGHYELYTWDDVWINPRR